jgi:acyl carrier protein
MTQWYLRNLSEHCKLESAEAFQGARMNVESLFERVLRLPQGTVTDETSNKTLRRWDSFNHIQLVLAIEETYKVKFSTAEISFKTVAEVKQLLRQKGVTF